MSNTSIIKNMKRVEPKSLLVLGNAKSLAPYPFDKYNVDTIGMSQAFRYWKKINWYPTYYICLDKDINRTFANDIKGLIKNRKLNGIKRFFLSKEILKKYPGFSKLKYVHFVEDLNQPGSRGFSGDTQVTSGSFAVRFGIWLGYTKIYILGIDSKYTPINMAWVKRVTDKNQRLIVNIDPDPDYFFDQYRMKGDHLHVPPPERMKVRTNHLITFKKVHRDFNQRRNKVVNCNNLSQLFKKKILPYETIPLSFTAWMPPTPPTPTPPPATPPKIWTVPPQPSQPIKPTSVPIVPTEPETPPSLMPPVAEEDNQDQDDGEEDNLENEPMANDDEGLEDYIDEIIEDGVLEDDEEDK